MCFGSQNVVGNGPSQTVRTEPQCTECSAAARCLKECLGVRTLAGGCTAVVRTDFLSPRRCGGRMTRQRFAFRCSLVLEAV